MGPWKCAPPGTRKGDRLGVNLPEPQTAAEIFTFLSSEKTRHEHPVSSSLFYCGIFILYLRGCVSACEMIPVPEIAEVICWYGESREAVPC